MIGTSKASPAATCRFVPSPDPNVALTLRPVLCSKFGMICSSASRMPPGGIRVFIVRFYFRRIYFR